MWFIDKYNWLTDICVYIVESIEQIGWTHITGIHDLIFKLIQKYKEG